MPEVTALPIIGERKIGLCAACEAEHLIEVVDFGNDDGCEWIAYRCIETGEEWERYPASPMNKKDE